MPEEDTVEKGGTIFRAITEGKATVLVPKDDQVFYNPIQQYNRDLSVLAIKTYGEKVVAKRAQKVAAGQKRKRAQKDVGDKRNGDQDSEKQNANGNEASLEESKEAPAKPPPFKILDALSASGLRGLRYAHEIPFVTSVVANDISKSAAEAIKMNVEHNGLQDKICVSNDDALAYLYRNIADSLTHKDRQGNPSSAYKMDVIDLDPYGTAATFLDAAVQAIRDDGGLLCVTCTDSAIFAGHSYAEKTYASYGGTPIKGGHAHEAGLRLILNAIAVSAARYGLAIDPQLSLSIDYYTKIFVKVTKSPKAVKFHGSKSMVVYTCDNGCGSWETQPLMKAKATPNKKGTGSFFKHSLAQGPSADKYCAHCGYIMHIGGPMYAGRIHSEQFVRDLLAEVKAADKTVYGTLPRLEGMLETALGELSLEPARAEGIDPREMENAIVDPWPFFVETPRMSAVLSCITPSNDLIVGALTHLGYQTGRSHCKPGSIKTNAPFSTIWWVMGEYIRQKSPVKLEKMSKSSAGWRLLSAHGITGEPLHEHQKPPSVSEEEAKLRESLVFDENLERLGYQPKTRLVRYQFNPPNWGPLTKAKSS